MIPIELSESVFNAATAVVAFNLIYHSHVPSRLAIDEGKNRRELNAKEKDDDDVDDEKKCRNLFDNVLTEVNSIG